MLSNAVTAHEVKVMNTIETLKDKVLNGKVFQDSWDYFFDHFADSDQFLAMGRRVRNADLEKILEKVGQQLVAKPKARASNFLLIEVKEYQLYHGSFSIDNSLASFMFFKDIDTGMVAVARSMRNEDVSLCRFCFTAILKGSAAIARQSPN